MQAAATPKEKKPADAAAIAKQIAALTAQVQELRQVEATWLKWGEEQLLNMPRLQNAYMRLVANAMKGDGKDPKDQLPHQRPPPPVLRASAQSLWNMKGWNKIMSSFNLMMRIRSQVVLERNSAAQQVKRISELEAEIHALKTGEDRDDAAGSSARKKDAGAVSAAVEKASALWQRHIADARAMFEQSGPDGGGGGGGGGSGGSDLDLSGVTRLLSATVRRNPMLRKGLMDVIGSLLSDVPLQGFLQTTSSADAIYDILTSNVSDPKLSPADKARALSQIVQLSLVRGHFQSIFDAIRLCLSATRDADIGRIPVPPALRDFVVSAMSLSAAATAATQAAQPLAVWRSASFACSSLRALQPGASLCAMDNFLFVHDGAGTVFKVATGAGTGAAAAGTVVRSAPLPDTTAVGQLPQRPAAVCLGVLGDRLCAASVTGQQRWLAADDDDDDDYDGGRSSSCVVVELVSVGLVFLDPHDLTPTGPVETRCLEVSWSPQPQSAADSASSSSSSSDVGGRAGKADEAPANVCTYRPFFTEAGTLALCATTPQGLAVAVEDDDDDDDDDDDEGEPSAAGSGGGSRGCSSSRRVVSAVQVLLPVAPFPSQCCVGATRFEGDLRKEERAGGSAAAAADDDEEEADVHWSSVPAGYTASGDPHELQPQVVSTQERRSPVCKNGDVMEVSEYKGDGYSSGYRCDRCQGQSARGHRGGSRRRWFCKECTIDICFDCHTEFLPVPVPDEATIAQAREARSTSTDGGGGSSDDGDNNNNNNNNTFLGSCQPIVDVAGNSSLTVCVTANGHLLFTGDGSVLGEGYVDPALPFQSVSWYVHVFHFHSHACKQ
jgi:hypothetical protein